MIALPWFVLLLAPAGEAAPAPIAVAVLVRPVERGEMLSVADFEQLPRAPGLAIGAVAAKTAAGRELVRALPAGAIVRASDTVAPRLVRRGEPVSISLRSRGLVIATAGRALSAGGMGELVRVVAIATNRTFDGVVEGSGAVRLGTP